jgi:hypothetical protein
MQESDARSKPIRIRRNQADASLLQLDDSRPLYRFVRKRAHAESLVSGNVWVSTLGTCRAYEDGERGDVGEGSLTYEISQLTGSGTDADFVRKAAKAGIQIGAAAEDITVSGSAGTQALSDAWLLCLTEEYDPAFAATFGQFSVRIDRPRSMFERISEELVRKHRTRVRGVAGPVTYRERSYADDEAEPGHIALVKPERYRWQREVRMVWWRYDEKPVSPQVVVIPRSTARAIRVV